jgi:uncharacterized protein
MAELDRRQFLGSVAAAVAATAAGTGRAETARLFEPAFRPLPLGAIRPEGWLLRQLRVQRDGLTGHLDEFWPDVAESQWFGGAAEGWERAPYWLDGALPLAVLLDDSELKRRLARRVDHVVAHQRPDGWYAPYPKDAGAKPYDLWAILLVNKALVQHHEATGDARVLEAVRASLRALHEGVARTPLFDWGRFRWCEGLVPAFYVHERTGEPWLVELARTLRVQGVDYEALYRTEDVTLPTPRRGLWKWTKHVVNTAMATKAAALSWRLDGKASDRDFATRMLEILDRHHGQVTGMFSGDECLAGRSPLQGTELCAVVEFLYSLETLFSVFGDPAFAERLERVAWNALPATIAPDMWSHQYDQQVNQAQCTVNPDHLWTTNGPESNVFGLEPNYGCCTSNLHQGWPKLAAHLWMRTKDEGLVAVVYAPCRVSFAARGVPVTVTVATDYPFRETVDVTVEPRCASGPARSSRCGRARCTGWRASGAARRRWRCVSRCGRSSAGATTKRSRSSAVRSSTRSRSASSGRASTPTSRTASCRTVTSRCGRPPPGTTGSRSTPHGSRARSPSRSGPSESGRSRPKARESPRERRGGGSKAGSS